MENVAARICREAGGRVTTNVLVRNLDLVGPDIADNRRPEVVADGVPLFGGAQLAIDTTLVSALRADGTARRRAADHDGVASAEARRRKARHTLSWPDFTGGRASLFLRLKSEADGRTRHNVSSPTWPELRPEETELMCRAVVAIAVGVILGLHCRSICGFDDAGTAWCSGR